ncbi:hypothetical protein F5Y16DRAFT_1138 [Xylariaceae sp. FL0255]|nr:hypothetical protein F5Y16DRAFT_1138 [Xylariaceae sp. FL0255]
MPKFQFVNVESPGDVKKHSTTIRKHVMKDIGKARRKPKKRKETTIARNFSLTADESTASAPNGREPGLEELTLSVPSPGRELSEIVFPIDMDEERMNLARYLFVEARKSYKPFRFPWLTMGLSDEAAWHITMANAVIFRMMKPGDTVKPEFSSSTDALKWYTLSLQSISRRLADPKLRREEGLLIAIAGFLCHDHSTGDFARQDIHLQGLKRLVDERGGIDSISNPMLRLMISWHDLAGASYRNTLPYFDVPKSAIHQIDTGTDNEVFQDLLDRWDSQCSHLGDVLDALKATAAVASYINRHSADPKFWTDDMTAARLLAPALYKVLALEGRALPEDPSDPQYSGTAAREAFRRSALIFLAAVKVRFGAFAWDLRRHVNDFRQISRIPSVGWGVVPEINLWAHTIAALHEESADRSFHVAAIVRITEFKGLASADEALHIVRSIIWVEEIFADRVGPLAAEIDALLLANAAQRILSAIDNDHGMQRGQVIEELDEDMGVPAEYQVF